MSINELTHFNEDGNAVMVDVSEKEQTQRVAIAKGRIQVNDNVLRHIQQKTVKKGDVLGVARIAGIMAAKRTSEWIPMCHLLMLTKCQIDFEIFSQTNEIEVTCLVKTVGKTGVEMEALTGVQAALLTIYDMCKAIDKKMVLKNSYLVSKTGGNSGDIYNESPIDG